jgi:DNA mismatch repair protein MutL
MRKINILTANVYNRIAAGEVIDRPYSAVKELIENSLDAGATQIEVYIEGGGKQLIKVVDNGCGIEKDDMRSAFLPHATSKIKNAEDLENITTLGFRGEALASISVIARVELVSVTQGNSAYRVVCQDEKIGDVQPAALECGTEITVRDLFYNTPVRAKFMKPDKKEEADITSFVSRYILSKPKVAFRYYVDGKLTLQSFGGGIDEAIAQVYGANVLSQCFKIDAEKNGVRVYGHISNQYFFKPNKTYQSLFLNGRYIINTTLQTAIHCAYGPYLMKRQYPFYVLNVEIPTDFVDVNVHPNKADVRFIDNNHIYGAVYSIITSILDGSSSAAKFVTESVRVPEIKSTSGGKDDVNKVYSVQADEEGKYQNKPLPENEVKINAEQQRIDDFARDVSANVTKPSTSNVAENKEEEKPQKEPRIASDRYEFITRVGKDGIKYYDPVESESLAKFMPKLNLSNEFAFEVGTGSNFVSDPRVQEARDRVEYEQQRILFESIKYRGCIFNTYLLYEARNTVYIIDQHAAHERLIYDRLCDKLAKRRIEMQSLIVPYLFTVNAEEKSFLDDNIMLIRNMGFDLKPFGAMSFRVDEVPVDLCNLNMTDFFDDLMADLKGLREIKLEDVLKDKIAQTACKHAVKGGMKLSDEEAVALFKQLEGNIGLKCPHGRPICVTMVEEDIEKLFKRIV